MPNKPNNLFDMMRNRHQFLAISRNGRTIHTSFFKFAYLKSDNVIPNFGMIVTKKIGNAVVRNKIKRRIRAMIREILKNIDETNTVKGYNFVIIARKSLYDGNYQEIERCLSQTLLKVSAKP